MTDAPELKPCPFCGDEAGLTYHGEECPPDPFCESWQVICCHCGASPDCDFDDQARAATTWNTRAAPKVKQLVWSEYLIASPEPYQIWSDNGGSGAPDDPYEKFENFRVFEPILMGSIGPVGDGTDQFRTIDDAKAAAQADYERRILEALE